MALSSFALGFIRSEEPSIATAYNSSTNLNNSKQKKKTKSISQRNVMTFPSIIYNCCAPPHYNIIALSESIYSVQPPPRYPHFNTTLLNTYLCLHAQHSSRFCHWSRATFIRRKFTMHHSESQHKSGRMLSYASMLLCVLVCLHNKLPTYW